MTYNYTDPISKGFMFASLKASLNTCLSKQPEFSKVWTIVVSFV